MSGETCGYAVTDKDGNEEPCGRPATGWRWYQDCPHEDTLERACNIHENEGGREIARLRKWKAEAMTVMAGLQELGKALGLPLGAQITGPEALAASEDLLAELESLRARVARLADVHDAIDVLSAALSGERP